MEKGDNSNAEAAEGHRIHGDCVQQCKPPMKRIEEKIETGKGHRKKVKLRAEERKQ